MTFGSKLYYSAITKFAEYADDELVEDCPLAKALIGKKLGDDFKINEYIYRVEKIVFPDGKILENKSNVVAPAFPAREYSRCEIDWGSGFATECTKEELQIIRDFEHFMAEEFPRFVGKSKINRITFCDPNIRLNGVLYSQFWFIKRGGVLLFRFKLNQNDKDESKYANNILVADSEQFETIKTLVRLIISSKEKPVEVVGGLI